MEGVYIHAKVLTFTVNGFDLTAALWKLAIDYQCCTPVRHCTIFFVECCHILFLRSSSVISYFLNFLKGCRKVKICSVVVLPKPNENLTECSSFGSRLFPGIVLQGTMRVLYQVD